MIGAPEAMLTSLEFRAPTRNDRDSGPVVIDKFRPDVDEPFSGVRCPLCQWRPSPSNRWSCACSGTPEPPFPACGATWNTFATGGLCPGCHHQWQWTSCLRCSQWSLHTDWYEPEP